MEGESRTTAGDAVPREPSSRRCTMNLSRITSSNGAPAWRVALVLLLASVVASPVALQGQEVGSAEVVPIQINGDPESFFTLVILGDGYTAEEMDRFREHVDKHLNVMWSIEPFRSYRNYINVFAVEIVSGESGIDCDPEIREERETPLAMSFSGGCTNPNARGINVGAAEARRYADMATPHYNQLLAIANTDTYGGRGGAVATTSGGNSLGPLITPHEFGHSLGRLQDEYTYRGRGVPGGHYQGGEPGSIHHTLMTEEEMLQRQAKWWRWLGEESEAGGVIGRFEGGQSNRTGTWRPAQHSMMISLGYYFDEVSRERMTARISEEAELITASTPNEGPISTGQVVWVATANPVYHELDVSWRVNGAVVRSGGDRRILDLSRLELGSGEHEVEVRVSDPTAYVRDPEVRERSLTAIRRWTASSAVAAPQANGSNGADEVAFTGHTQTERPVGGTDVVFVETTQPGDRVLEVGWVLNGREVPVPAGARHFHLAHYGLSEGTHTLRATVSDPADPEGETSTLTWVVDNTPPTVEYSLSESEARVARAGGGAHYFMRDDFTMALDARDDQPGYVVAEFRLNGDGWHHYYGWPDAPEGTPFHFTPRGTNIKELVYGSLSSEGLSPQPWEAREPGWGTHRIEVRGIDAAGNIGEAEAFRVTLRPSPECTVTIEEDHEGELLVERGTTCVRGARIEGGVRVFPGASLVATDALLQGGLSAEGAGVVELVGTTVGGAARIAGSRERVTLFDATVIGALHLEGNRTESPVELVGSTVTGGLTCRANEAAPVDLGTPNTLRGPVAGECRGF